MKKIKVYILVTTVILIVLVLTSYLPLWSLNLGTLDGADEKVKMDYWEYRFCLRPDVDCE